MGQQKGKTTRGSITQAASSTFRAGAIAAFKPNPESDDDGQVAPLVQYHEPAGAGMAVLQSLVVILAAPRDSNFHDLRHNILVIQPTSADSEPGK